MDIDPSNLLSTPTNTANPQQVQALRDYSAALMKPNTKQVLYSPWQGLGNVLTSLIGGYYGNKSDMMQNQMNKMAGDQRTSALPSLSSQTPQDQQASVPNLEFGRPSEPDLMSSQEAPKDEATPQTSDSTGTYDVIKKFEGFSPKPYGDYKQTSIGYGTRAQPGETSISREDADARLAQEASKVDSFLDNNVTVPLSGARRAALVSFGYNLGTGKGGLSDLVGDINNQDWNSVSQRMQRYVHAGGQVNPGLVDRRRQEGQMVLNGGGDTQAAPNNAAPGDNVQDFVSSLLGSDDKGAVKVSNATPQYADASRGVATDAAMSGAPAAQVSQNLSAKDAPQAQQPGQFPSSQTVTGPLAPQPGTYIDPKFLPPRIQISRDQMVAVNSNPWIPEENKNSMYKQYLEQNNPIASPLGGGTVVANPRNTLDQTYIPAVEKGMMEPAPGMKVPYYHTMSPQGIGTIPSAPQSGAPQGSAQSSNVDENGMKPFPVNGTIGEQVAWGRENTAQGEAMKKSAENAAEMEKEIHQQSTAATKVLGSTAELRNLSQGFNPGALSQAKEQVGKWAQALGIPSDTVNSALGNVGSIEAFQKQTAILAAEAAKQVSSKTTQMEFETYLKNNPNIFMTPGGLQLVIDRIEKMAHSSVEKEQQFSDWKSSHPATKWNDFDTYWNKQEARKNANGYYNSQPNELTESGGPSEFQDSMRNARDALARGVSRDVVINKLKKQGIDTGGL